MSWSQMFSDRTLQQTSFRAITNPLLANRILTVTVELGQTSETNIPKTEDFQDRYSEEKDQSVEIETDEDEEDENEMDDTIDLKLHELQCPLVSSSSRHSTNAA